MGVILMWYLTRHGKTVFAHTTALRDELPEVVDGTVVTECSASASGPN